MTSSTNGNQANTLPVSVDQIQYCHDLLNAVLNEDLPVPVSEIMEIDERIMIEMASSLSVLCWLLGHENPQFIDNLTNLEQALDDAGIVFEMLIDN